MDAEPFRCRRTDGKKWRCRLRVIPDQKYCERHVHRGRVCSRKPVEVDNIFLKSKSTTSNLHAHAKTNRHKVSVKNDSLKIKKHSMEIVLQHGNGLVSGVSSNNQKIGQPERCCRTDGKKWRCKKEVLPGLKYCVQHMHRGAKKVKNDQKSDSCLSFPVGATYQQIAGLVSGASSKDLNIGQPERYRRTDGKKRRCKKEVLPRLKYCVQHMHRGAKKVKHDQKSDSCLSFPVGATFNKWVLMKVNQMTPTSPSLRDPCLKKPGLILFQR
ncbi:growth-regulating factor 9-like [Bidens hawaiensis]|uniref:growth-regulating factor 9-like n=1 Tax=Bidens hawaiensis TaxID=980011 RepID=UPI00404B8F1C